MPRVLVLHRRRPRRDLWTAAFAADGFEVDAHDSVKSACMALWQHDHDAIVAETPDDADLAALLESAPGPWPPPILLVGAPFQVGVGVPRAFAAAICLGDPPAARVPVLLRALLANARDAHPMVPHGRADVPLRLPPARVAKWKSWLLAA